MKDFLHSASGEWTAEQAAALTTALAARPGPDGAREKGALGYCELAGFFFALACSPELIAPRQWLPEVLGEEEFASQEEANRVVGLVFALYNRVNLDVLEGKPELPAGIDVHAEPEANFGPDAPLGRWAGGFGAGQLWTEEAWERRLAAAPESERRMLDETIGGLNSVLSFFMNRDLGERFRRKMPGAPSLAEAARRVLEALPMAMQAQAELGRGPDAGPAAAPERSAKVGRNAPCPCGSGRLPELLFRHQPENQGRKSGSALKPARSDEESRSDPGGLP